MMATIIRRATRWEQIRRRRRERQGWGVYFSTRLLPLSVT
jgi:hypothetical protein